jgi:HSP20 family protein
MATETAMTKQENRELQAERVRGNHAFVPKVDIIEQADKFTLRAEVPGVKPSDVDVTYERGELRIYGKVQPRQDLEKTNWMLREYVIGDFYRAFQIGEGVDGGRINASLQVGILTLDLPKRPEATPRKITVKSS